MRTIALAPSARRIALALALLLTASLSLLAVGDVSARAGGQQPRMSGDVDLRRGAVYGLSNDPAGNRVVAFSRSSDGTLAPAGSFATKGTGSGGFEDSANGLVLGSARGEAAPNNLLNYGRLLFATNAGSDNLSVFRVHRRKLALVEVQDSRGAKPVSVTVNRGVVYVLNSGETVDGLTPRNCTQGARPSVTGFRVTEGGQLTPIPGSTRQLSGDRESGCAQVSFNPSGEVLMVTERFARTAGQASGDEGVINTFVVKDNGTLGRQRIFDATGQGPFGFTFNKRGALLTTEQFDGILGQAGARPPATPSVSGAACAPPAARCTTVARTRAGSWSPTTASTAIPRASSARGRSPATASATTARCGYCRRRPPTQPRERSTPAPATSP